jgi:NodT family efflux transporter outer membrane factor (OMF) lipoprotein
MITRNTFISFLVLAFLAIATFSCVPDITKRDVNKNVPETYNGSQDSVNSARVQWRSYFSDSILIALIDTALENNQELNILLQEIEISRNEVKARKGEYLPFVNLGAGAGLDKTGRYTRNGALEENLNIREGQSFPDPLGDFTIGAYATWEVDIWKKLRNAKKSAMMRYLSSVEGRNFMVTNLIAEVAGSYYELVALDNQLSIIVQNIEIQNNALTIVRLQKQSARVTELAVRRFEAQVFSTRSLQFQIQQRIIETENRIKFLIGGYQNIIPRNSANFNDLIPDGIRSGIPSQLLENRPDVRQAEMEVMAANLDIKVAKANFYPSLGITAGVGYQAFNPDYLIRTPESLVYSMFGDLAAPLVNRNAIKAQYKNANARQIQAAFNYEQTVLNAYLEVQNQLAKIDNLQSAYDLKSNQVQALNESIDISITLFKSARADYMEVLLTQKDALESRFDLIDTKMEQIQAWVNIYKALGGGWN